MQNKLPLEKLPIEVKLLLKFLMQKIALGQNKICLHEEAYPGYSVQDLVHKCLQALHSMPD
jgi:hypothetical protein